MARPAPVPSPAAPLVAAQLNLPTGWRLAAPDELVSSKALIGRSVLFRWPDEGWVRCKVARVSRAAGFLHVPLTSSQRSGPLSQSRCLMLPLTA